MAKGQKSGKSNGQPGPATNGHQRADARRAAAERLEAAKVLFPGLKHKVRNHAAKLPFLVALAQSGQLVKAADAVGIARYTPYLWMKDDPIFAEGVEFAQAMAAKALESELMRRAMDGVEKGVYYKGERVATEQEYSDLLGIFLLKGAMPDKYRETRHTTHDVSPGMVALQQQWLALRDAPPPPPRELPASEDVIDVQPEAEEPAPVKGPGLGRSQSKAETFAMLDKLQGYEPEYEDAPGRVPEVDEDIPLEGEEPPRAEPRYMDPLEAQRQAWLRQQKP